MTLKTTDTYAIKTATLVGYIDQLISEKRISSWENALGLYIVGRPDPELRQLENAIVAERRTHQLRVMSVESLLSLAEIMSDYDVRHEDILFLLRPSGPGIDALVDLIARLVAQRAAEQSEAVVTQVAPSLMPRPIPVTTSSSSSSKETFWLTPVKDHTQETAIECVENLVGKNGMYAFGERTPGRTQMRQGDWICFYAAGTGVIAHARIATPPENKPDERVLHPQDYPYTCRLQDQVLYADKPIVINTGIRQKLNAFNGRDPDRPWAWFVQATRKVTKQDFDVLTHQNSPHS